MPTDNGKPVDFTGSSGPGALINLYLPQPGQHTGRRIIRIDDIDPSIFLDTAAQAGTPWHTEFGLEKHDKIWEIIQPEKLTDRWFDRYSKARGVSRATLAPLQTALESDARATLAMQGGLSSWARSGTAASARMSTRPDAAGNSDPLPPPDPGSTTQSQVEAVTAAGALFTGAIHQFEDGTIRIPSEGWGGIFKEAEIDLDEPPTPAFFLVQVIGISSFLGDYGLGRTIKTFTLLPGEVTNIHTRTWRATEETRAEASSIIDSYDEHAKTRFAETVLNETTDAATREKTENWHVESGAKASIGIASASVSGGGGGEYSSSTEEFARSLDEAVREHAAEASSHRENTVTSSSERSVSTEDEQVIERTIRNINVSRVLNHTFRELNQQHDTLTHLKDIRIAFGNGQAGSWREVPVAQLRQLVEEYIVPQHVNRVCSDILGTIAIVRDVQERPVTVLEQVRLNRCGTDFQARDAQPDDECNYPPPSADGRFYYRFKRGPLAQPADTRHPVDGVVLSRRTLIMKTDSVVVEALLGVNSALDNYSEHLQLEAIREKQLANDREQLAQTVVRDGLEGESQLYQRVFGNCCGAPAEPAAEEPT